MDTRLARHASLPQEHDILALIDQAHLRSRAFGIASDDEPDHCGLLPSRLKDALEENRFLFQHAVPVMEALNSQIANTHSMVLLTSAEGLVLHSMGDSDFLEKADRVALVPGMDWSERKKGTNAVGTALSVQQPVTVHGSQHYMNANHGLTCSCAPILDPYGRLVGALDVTGDHRSYHQHTLALARMSAQMIENHMFAGSFPHAVRVHFHSRGEFLGTLVEGIAAFTPEGRFISANRSAQMQLGMSFGALQAHTFSSLFGQPISALQELSGSTASTVPRQFCLHTGVMVWCHAEAQPARPWTAPATSPLPGKAQDAPPQRSGSSSAAAAAAATRRAQLSSLQYLDTGDAQLAAIIAKLRKVADRDIPVMILGETGSGKDLLAQAIHNDSARAAQPFVAVNCASIPDTLIEAELFGYEEGAFTGARKKGAPGKIQQAHGGTLFLDEIGDMPPHLQARLLRVLQERKVSPLGAGREVEVDVTVISATHKNLKELIAGGTFREDLYYRLNGLVVRLPALRERSDFDAVMKKVLHAQDGGAQVTIEPQALELMRAYHWPGNVRQLYNLLRTACAMVDDDRVIRVEHLPDDFLDELRVPLGPEARSLATPVVAAAAEPAAGSATPCLQDVTLQAMAQMLRLHKGNLSAAAKALGVSRNTIYRKKNLLPPDLLN